VKGRGLVLPLRRGGAALTRIFPLAQTQPWNSEG